MCKPQIHIPISCHSRRTGALAQLVAEPMMKCNNNNNNHEHAIQRILIPQAYWCAGAADQPAERRACISKATSLHATLCFYRRCAGDFAAEDSIDGLPSYKHQFSLLWSYSSESCICNRRTRASVQLINLHISCIYLAFSDPNI